jgi:hypothetical protein
MLPGCATHDLSVSTVLPISKGKNLNYSDSIRTIEELKNIALSSTVGQIFYSYTYSTDTIIHSRH